MPTINPALVPTISPGNMFSRFTTDTTLNVRWITPTDPVFYEAINRPMADITLRQLIIAKAIDAIELNLGHLALFPFLIPCKVTSGTSIVDLPVSWIWDMHPSLPSKWEYLRLAKIERISGGNAGSGSEPYTGYLRLVFAAQEANTAIETSLFYADYKIDSDLTYQFSKVYVIPPTMSEITNPVDYAEAGTISGYLIFRTLDQSDSSVSAFYDLLQPPTVPIIGSDGFFTNPTVYEIVDSGTSTDDFYTSVVVHGTGMLVVSAWNPIPSMDSDFNTWLESNNYPFRMGASRTSVDGITIPAALFREFNIVVPSYDEETGDTSKQNSPVWISSIERLDVLANQLRFVFSTYTIVANDSSPQIVEFAAIVLDRTYVTGQVVNIEPIGNLLKVTTSEADNFLQGFGTGHVVLSSLWSGTSAAVTDFFDDFLAVTSIPAVSAFAKDTTILSSYSTSRVPRFVPTAGQSGALAGSSARRTDLPKNPSDDNRYITEEDTGLGEPIDFRTYPGFPDPLRNNTDIEPIGYCGTSVHKLVKLIVDQSGTAHSYDTDILPRLRCLLGRDPVFGDIWFDGTYFKMNSGDTWITL